MRFKIEVALALGFGGLALTGLILPILGYIFLGLSALVLIDIVREKANLSLRFPIMRRIPKAAQQPSNQAQSKSGQLVEADRRKGELAEALELMGTDDSVNLSVRVITWALPVEQHLRGTERRPYFDFVFGVANASVLPVDAGSSWDGHIEMDGTTLTQRLEILNPGQILHGEVRIITVRQWLSDDDANDAVAWNKSDQLPFDFKKLNLWMVAKWLGFENEKARLALPDLVRLPTQGLMR